MATAGANTSTQRGPLGPFLADTVKFFVAKKAGAQTVAALAATETLYNDTDRNLTIVAVRASVGTAPVGATLIADVQIAGTSAWATTTANRPTIAAAATTGLAGAPDTAVIKPGEAVTFSVLQIGSGTAGSDLALQLTLAAA